MASALEAVLNLKAQEKQAEAQRSQQITEAVTLLQNAKQQALANKLALKKYDSDLAQQTFENTIKTRQQTSMEDYLKLIGGQNSGTPALSTTPAPSENSVPTLQDAFPQVQQTFIQTPYMSPAGKVGVSNKLDPEYNKKLELRTSQIKDLEEFSNPIESFSVGIKSMRDAIAASPDYKPGIGSKIIAGVQNKVADINNEPWFNNYDLAYQQNVLPAAQSLGASKVLSDRDLENIKKSLGDYTTPKEIKIKALDDLTNKIGEKVNSKLQAYGVDKDKYSSIYPNAAKEFVSKEKKSIKQLDANIAKQLLSEAGGDKNKARELARQKGYTF